MYGHAADKMVDRFSCQTWIRASVSSCGATSHLRMFRYTTFPQVWRTWRQVNQFLRHPENVYTLWPYEARYCHASGGTQSTSCIVIKSSRLPSGLSAINAQICGLLPWWLSFCNHLFFVTSLAKAFLSQLFSQASSSRRAMVVSNLFHSRNMEAIVLLGTVNAAGLL